MMRTAFIGATKFGLRCLDLIHHMDCCEAVGVVTAPAIFTISYQPSGMKNILHADFPSYCKSQEISCVEMSTGMKDSALFDQVCKWSPDIFIVVGWYHLIPKKWRQLAPCYRLHAS